MTRRRVIFLGFAIIALAIIAAFAGPVTTDGVRDGSTYKCGTVLFKDTQGSSLCEDALDSRAKLLGVAAGLGVLIAAGGGFLMSERDRSQHSGRTLVTLNKPTTSGMVIAGSGSGLLIAYFLPWFRIYFEGGQLIIDGQPSGFVSESTINYTGRDVGFFFGTFPMLIGLVAAVVVIIGEVFGVKLLKRPAPWRPVFLGAGGLAAALVVVKLFTGYHSIDRTFGLFIATLAAVGLAAGGFLRFREGDHVTPVTTPDTTAAATPPRPEAVTGDLRPCPHCAEDIKQAANVCRFCGRDIAPAS